MNSNNRSPIASTSNNLFKPLRVGNIEIKHRIALAPLTRFRSPNHLPLEDLVGQYYEQRGQAPGTLLISEATYISPKAVGYPGAMAPGIWSDEQTAVWANIIDRVHKKDSFLFMQLWSLGRAADPRELKRVGVDYVAPSAVIKPSEKTGMNLHAHGEEELASLTPRALTIPEIKEIVSDFVKASKNAIKAGADGVEIHAANGYLIDQFLHDNTNLRTDEYGGVSENRARFLLEIVDAVSEAIGSTKVGIRLSPWNSFGEVSFDISPIPVFSHIAAELQKRANAGKPLAYVHIVEPSVNGPEDAANIGLVLDKNAFIANIWKGPLIRAGNLKDYVSSVADSDDRTITALGRYFISNPDLVARIRDQKELAKYDRSTFYWDAVSSPAKGYTDYPNAE